MKRLWDTENKKIVWLRDGKKAYQVWTDGDKLYVYYKGQRMEYNPSTSEAPAEEYGPTWAELEDQEVGYYDTNVPTNMYSWDEGDEVAYAFKNGSTTLQSGKVDEGETPEYTGDTPTKAATAQYTYTFSGWKPEVGPIYKKTDYKAQFTSEVNEYTITFVDDDGTTELDEQTLEYGATPVYEGETPTKEATAQYTYTFSGWTPAIATVTADATYTATYSSEVNEYDLTIGVNDDTMGSVDLSSVEDVPYGTAISAEGNVLIIGTGDDKVEVTATPETGYAFSSWGVLPASVSEDATITATFEAEGGGGK